MKFAGEKALTRNKIQNWHKSVAISHEKKRLYEAESYRMNHEGHQKGSSSSSSSAGGNLSGGPGKAKAHYIY